MTEPFSRRDWLKTVGAAAIVPVVPSGPVHPTVPVPLHLTVPVSTGDILELYSTSEVFTPARGNSLMRFSFDFPEPAVVFAGHRFSVLVFTDENTYAMDRSLMRASYAAITVPRVVTSSAGIR